jgi:exodeoxyribonuclease V alpha subunit
VAARLARLLAERTQAPRVAVNPAAVKAVSRDLGFALSEEQESVLHVLAGEKVAVLTGGPGTGKTATTRAVIRLFQQANLRVLLAAPTGRAAKRLSETTGEDACTIHRLLEYKPVNSKFDRNEDNPLDADLLVIDEMSMVDNILMHHLLKAVRTSTRMLLVGDADQLPSVGAGNILRDLIASERIATIRLHRIFRQEAGSSIIENAHRINAGEMPHLSAKPEHGANFFFFNAPEPEAIRDTVLDLCTHRIREKFGFDPMTQVQVLTPMYRGMVGVDHLNEALQNKLNPGRDVPCGNRSFRVGDRVMQIKNNYDKEVYNGDVGLVRRIEPQENALFVQFPDQPVKYDFKELDQLVLAYAITVHKSQGSEYPAVVLPMTTHHFPMLQRNLLYTAVTRARDLVVIAGSHKAVAIAVKNNKIEERYTALGERLKRALDDSGLFKV